jgi:hypothetical protein
MENLLMNDSVASTSVPTCLHPGCDVSGDGYLSECGLCRGRMCINHDCDCPLVFANDIERLEFFRHANL